MESLIRSQKIRILRKIKRISLVEIDSPMNIKTNLPKFVNLLSFPKENLTPNNPMKFNCLALNKGKELLCHCYHRRRTRKRSKSRIHSLFQTFFTLNAARNIYFFLTVTVARLRNIPQFRFICNFFLSVYETFSQNIGNHVDC